MTYLYHIGLGIVIIVLQTTIFQQIRLLAGFYDLLIVLVIYLGLYHPLRESVIIIGLLGLAMDSLTGGPYGLYLTTYFWIFVVVRWSFTYFHLSSVVVIPFVVAFGVMLENLIHLTGTVSLESNLISIAKTDFRTVMLQVLWAVLTGPLVLVLISILRHRSGKWLLRMFGRRPEN